jgi:hypothetical protein
VREDGSGRVAVRVVADPAAVQALTGAGGSLEERVRTSDLADRGWKISPWSTRPDGSATVVLTKPFTTVDQVGGILDEISGPNGPLHDFRATRERKFFSKQFAVRGRIDVSKVESGVASDADLAARLAEQGLDVAMTDQQLTAALRAALIVRLAVHLPDGGGGTVTVGPGDSAPVDVRGSVTDSTRTWLVVAAAACVVVAGLALLWPRRRGRRGRPGRPGRRALVASGGNGSPEV